MKVAARILEQYPELTESQRAVVGHVDGPLLVIAGPGSGKTHSIVLRALNLLLLRLVACYAVLLLDCRSAKEGRADGATVSTGAGVCGRQAL